MKANLTEEESMFLDVYEKTGNAAESFREAFPEQSENLDELQQSRRGNTLLKKQHIQEWLALANSSVEELGIETLRKLLLLGKTDPTSIRAADIALKFKGRDSIKKATERFWETSLRINAVALIPHDGE